MKGDEMMRLIRVTTAGLVFLSTGIVARAQHDLPELPNMGGPPTTSTVQVRMRPASYGAPAPAQPPAPTAPPAPEMPSLTATLSGREAPVAPNTDCSASSAYSTGGWKERLRGCIWGYPEEFIAPPLGTSVYAFGNTMVSNGEASRMVLYRYDFVPGTDQLSFRGKDQLARIALLLGHNDFPIVVERGVAPSLDEARRLAVMNELGQNGIKVPPERVVVGQPVAIGLRGTEAEIVYQNFLIEVQSGGTRAGAGGGSIGGTVGAGFNAPGR
jgi:hypothetical protein